MSVFEDFAEFGDALGVRKSIIGLDLGTKTIGVAVSDRLWTLATPRETINRKKFTVDAEALMQIICDVEACAIILGLPMNMDGTAGPRVQSTRAFAQNFSKQSELPIGFWDERLSTVAAERAMLEADMSRAKRAEAIDHVAAGFILQGALDRLRHMRDG